MNFIKKKLKSHKKDNEEEEYEKAVYEQSLHSGDQKVKNTEEWQFFQQLSMKVQDTVQKTQTTLNKLKDIRQDSIGKDDDDFTSEGDLLYRANKTAVTAPPRPPPPDAEKSSLTESQFDSENVQSSSRAPPRPPPPPGAEVNLISENILYGTSSKSSPARPPPPIPAKSSVPLVLQSVSPTNQIISEFDPKPPDTAFALLDEFGFQPATTDSIVVSSKSNFQDLLFLDVKEETDPFDTSFVDVTSIVSLNQPLEKKESMLENVLNPFAYNTDFELKENEDNLFSSKKNITNPFASMSNQKELESTNDAIWSMHNPFSVTEVTEKDLTLLDDVSRISNFKQNDLTQVLNCNVESIQPNIQETTLLEIETSSGHICESSSLDNFPQELELNNLAHSDVSHDFEKPEEVIDCVESANDDSVLWPSDISPKDVQFETKSNYQAFQEDNSSFIEEIMDNNKLNAVDVFDSEASAEVITESVTALHINNADEKEETDVLECDENVSSAIHEDKNGDPPPQFVPFDTYVPAESEVGISSDIAVASTIDINKDSFEIFNDGNQGEKTSLFSQNTDSFAFKFMSEPVEEFDDFSAKFESAKAVSSSELYDPFSSEKAPSIKKIKEGNLGFGSMDEFDPFKVTKSVTLKKESSRDSFEEYDNEADFSVVIKPKVKELSSFSSSSEPPKLLPPPPKTPTKTFDSNTSRFNPFDKNVVLSSDQTTHDLEKETIEPEVEEEQIPALGEAGVRKADSVETPLSPLFDEDTSLPLETFCLSYPHEGWEMVLRQPNKKKLTGNRFWKKVYVKLSENSVLQLFNKSEDKLAFQELPLQACYSLSEVGAQQYDQYGKIFTMKLQYKFYRERVGVRPGQISKVTQGHITSMGDVAKLGLPLQHAPQTSQLLKLGTHSYSDIKAFMQEVEDAFFRINVHRDRVLTYKTEEIQVIAQDEFRVEQSKTGHVEKQLARVRIFFLAFITGMPSVEVGLNDINRQGKEVVGRYDIMPVVTEEWIRLEDCEFHSCVIQEEFNKTRIIKFHPPDACLFELLRFRIRPPRNRELPLQVRVFMAVSSSRVEIRSDILVPGYSSRKQGQIPCENIQIRFPIPECWIYLFRTEKHFRYGSKKSTARRPGKIKGLERIIGAAQNLDPSLIEVSAGQAKYEHVFHAVVWRIPRLPKEGQGAYTQQLFLLRTELTAFDQIPDTFEPYVDVEFTMPATYVSHTTVRSVSVTNPSAPEKYVRYISKHEYKVEIEFKSPDDIDGLITTPNVTVPVSAAVQESTEDEKDEDSD